MNILFNGWYPNSLGPNLKNVAVLPTIPPYLASFSLTSVTNGLNRDSHAFWIGFIIIYLLLSIDYHITVCFYYIYIVCYGYIIIYE